MEFISATMLGDKRIILHENDDIIIDEKRYDRTSGLYELIFISQWKYLYGWWRTYRSILLMTNAHRRSHSPSNQVMSSKGYKYKNIIAPLVSGKKVGTRINKRMDLSRMMMLNDNKIDPLRRSQQNWIICDCSRPRTKWIIMITTMRFCWLSKSFAKPVWL